MIKLTAGQRDSFEEITQSLEFTSGFERSGNRTVAVRMTAAKVRLLTRVLDEVCAEHDNAQKVSERDDVQENLEWTKPDTILTCPACLDPGHGLKHTCA